jgi:hypothetical protein
MTVAVTHPDPVLYGVYQHRMAELEPGQHRPSCPDVIVLAVVPFRERRWVLLQYTDHRPGRRDAVTLSLDEFWTTYPTLIDHLQEPGAGR